MYADFYFNPFLLRFDFIVFNQPLLRFKRRSHRILRVDERAHNRIPYCLNRHSAEFLYRVEENAEMLAYQCKCLRVAQIRVHLRGTFDVSEHNRNFHDFKRLVGNQRFAAHQFAVHIILNQIDSAHRIRLFPRKIPAAHHVIHDIF